MTEVSPGPRDTPRAAAGMLALALAGVAGCAWVPRGRIDDCRQRIQVLQAENQQLRDVAVHVRQENKDLAQRALDDSRRLRAQEEAIRRFERSIAAYQEEREQILALLDQIRGQVRTAALAPPTTAMIGGLEDFARSHPACRLDAASGTLRLPVAGLFEAGGATPTAEAVALLDELAASLEGSADEELALRVAGPGEAADGAVRLASGPDGPDRPRPEGASDGPRLGLERARTVRDRLVERLGLDPARVAIAPGGRATIGAGDAETEDPAPDEGWLVIQVRRAAAPRVAGPRRRDGS